MAQTGTRAERKQARPREILQAAFEEFSLRGYAATNVEHIADRVGVTKGTIYVYFPSKEDVFENMIAELAQPSIDSSLYLKVLNTGTAIDTFDGFLRDLYQVMVQDRYTSEVWRFLVAEANAFGSLRRKYREAFALPVLSTVQAIVKHGCEKGEFRKEAADLDPLLLIIPLLGLNVARHIDPEFDVAPDRFIEQHILLIRYFLEEPGKG